MWFLEGCQEFFTLILRCFNPAQKAILLDRGEKLMV